MRTDWRACVRRGWLAIVFVGLAALAPPLAGFGGRAFADDAVAKAGEAKPAAEVVSASLKNVFAGAAPASVADLRAMQSHVQSLTERLKKSTVGVNVGNAWGSGVIVSKDGYVLTAAHVAGRPNRTDQVTFTLADGREVIGKTLGLFRTVDAGLMKITEPGEYPHAEMGSSDNLVVGQWCLALGHPGGYQEERGMVLRLGRILVDDPQDKVIVTDCTLVGGDSGGPLFDMDGRVIGINSRIAQQLNSNMHVPVSSYKETWDRLVKGDAWGHLPGQEPWLGVKGAANAQDALIESVTPGSPADQAGIKPGDVIIGFDGERITSFESLRAKVQEWQPSFGPRRGRGNWIQVLRGGEIVELQLFIRPRE